jgi:hypothetical protein
VEEPSVVVVVVTGAVSTAVGVVAASVAAGAVAVSVVEQPSSAARITVIILTPYFAVFVLQRLISLGTLYYLLR